MKLGIFAPDEPRPDPLAKAEGQNLSPNPPVVGPHNIWTKVCWLGLDILFVMLHKKG